MNIFNGIFIYFISGAFKTTSAKTDYKLCRVTLSVRLQGTTDLQWKVQFLILYYY